MDQNNENNIPSSGDQGLINQPSSPITNSPIAATDTSGSLGPIIGTIIVVAILVLGGLYYWSKQNVMNYPESTSVGTGTQGETYQERPAEDMATQKLSSQSNSDDIQSIDADLKATALDNLSVELSDPANAPQ